VFLLRTSISLSAYSDITRGSVLLTVVSHVGYSRLNDKVCERQKATVRPMKKARGKRRVWSDPILPEVDFPLCPAK
jgi:hypothetical protein